MATPRKIIRDYRYEPEAALVKRKAVIAQQQARYGDDPRLIVDGGRRVIPPYYPREPIDAGDPLSPSGTKVELSELADDVIDAIGSGGGGGTDHEEVVLTFSATVPPGTAINIQTGAYTGAGSPATVACSATVTLPTTGAAFACDAEFFVERNGQDLIKGSGLGSGEAQWVSTTQLAFSERLRPGDVIRIVAPE